MFAGGRLLESVDVLKMNQIALGFLFPGFSSGLGGNLVFSGLSRLALLR
jgi:hypothetical protein